LDSNSSILRPARLNTVLQWTPLLNRRASGCDALVLCGRAG